MGDVLQKPMVNRLVVGSSVVGAPLALCAETTAEVVDGVFAVTVPAGETCAMAALIR